MRYSFLPPSLPSSLPPSPYLEPSQAVNVLHISTLQATTIDEIEHPPVIAHGGNEPVPVVGRLGLPEGPTEGLGVLFDEERGRGGREGGREEGLLRKPS